MGTDFKIAVPEETAEQKDAIEPECNNKPHDDKRKPKIELSPNCKPHNNKPITLMELSPNGQYLVTYSKEDNSIVGWNVVDEGRLEPDMIIQTVTVKIAKIVKPKDETATKSEEQRMR